jgi:hypothetical protein
MHGELFDVTYGNNTFMNLEFHPVTLKNLNEKFLEKKLSTHNKLLTGKIFHIVCGLQTFAFIIF